MARYVVTGADGFIGRHLCAALLARGATICDTLDGASGCFHLATSCLPRIPLPSSGAMDFIRYTQPAADEMIPIVEAAAKAKVPLVYASSAAVYGAVPADETKVCVPLSLYGAGKLRCELEADVSTKLHGLAAVGLRLFNIYGPGQRSGIIPEIHQAVMENRPMDIFGDGSQTRDFIHIADAVDALLSAMDRMPMGGPFNVGTGVPTRINTLLAQVGARLGVMPKVRFLPQRAWEIRESVASPYRGRVALGLHDPIPLAAGLATTLVGEAVAA